MRRPHIILAVAAVMSLSVLPGAHAQNGNKSTSPPATAKALTISEASTPLELARAAYVAQGGEKFKNVKNMVMKGSVNLYPPNSTQSIPGAFVIVTEGDRIRLDVNAAPIITFTQIFDGQNIYNSMPNVPPLPPPSRFGLPLLAKFDQPGYTVTAVQEKRKKQLGFRISNEEGQGTDFYIDPATAYVVFYQTQFTGYVFATENKNMKEVEGVLVPYSFSQKLQILQGTGFAEYNVKDVKLNQTLGEDVFTIPK